ncbi:MAG: disulfide oxidoreductase, partial [Alphaproteobacteria bacterium]|nr:disulfide oxidoreductase [Alphaproteobacteria bacterium]
MPFNTKPLVKAILGPTNTGKTYLAIDRMLGHESGMIGFPLRLLARENYDRVVQLKGAGSVALITGEERIVPSNPRYYLCTVEAMPSDISVAFLAIDEIQLCADPERGHVFTDRLLHARGTQETMLMGAETMAPIIRQLVPDVQFDRRERLSRLSYGGFKKLTRLPPRSAVVAFSAANVYAVAELLRSQSGGAAVVLGALSPRTRNAQVAMYEAGEVE